MAIAPVVAFVSVLAVAAVVAAQQEPASYKSSPYLRVDPDKIVITDAAARTPCGDCHTPEWEVWKETKHATGFETMHKSESAQGILEAMDLRVTKRQEALCMRCHYTVGPGRKAIAGVSCESCHGPAANWVNVHNSWDATDRDKETPAARAARIAESRQAGMLRPSTDIYAVAANCFECHTVPIEDLVNRGGHKAGTSGFELVKRVNSIRHNFLDSAGQSSGANREMTRERARLMYVVGRMLAYEYSLRGLAAATAPGAYARSMTNRATDAAKRLDEIASAVTIPAVTQVLRSNTKLRLVPGNRAPLEAAADSVRAIGERFVAANTGSTFAALDRFIAGAPAAQVADSPDPTAAVVRDPGESRAAATPTGGTASAGAAATKTAPAAPAVVPAAPAVVPAAPAVAPAAPPSLPGALRNRPAWHTTEFKSNVTDAGECAGCHSVAEAKLADSKHQQAAQRLTGENAKARRIAELYGIGAAGMARSDRLCMSCHATVDEATKTVHETGVTCEACHGAGAAYKDTHRKAGGSKEGMRPLKRADVRARLCADCHWITDERLLAAGHPDGSKKDFVKANKDIEHWPDPKATRGRGKDVPYPTVSDEALRTAISPITAARPIPRVSVVEPQPRVAQREPPADVRPQATGQVPARPPRPRVAKSAQSSIPPSVPTALPRRVTRDNVSLQLEPLPATQGMTIEELMLLIKQRTARIHTAIRRANPQP